MQEVILQREYIAGGYYGDSVNLVYRNDVGMKMVCSFEYGRYVYIRTDDESKLPRSKLYRRVKGLSRLSGYTRLEVGWYDEFDDFMSLMRDNNITVLEGDVKPIRRVFADYDLKISSSWRCLFLDIETSDDNPDFTTKETWRVLSCSFATLEGKHFHFVANDNDDDSELVLLNRILRVIISYDVVLAWNGDNFDFTVLKARCKYYDINFPWWKVNLLDYMLVYKKYSGRDDIKTSFKLDDVGENVVGVRKIIRNKGIIELLKTDKDELKRYNDRDVEIMILVEKAKGFLQLHLQVCKLCFTFPNRNSLYSSELMDGLMLRRAREANYHYTSRISMDEADSSKFEGAYVMDPIPGLYSGVSVFDFASLYPSIIISYNMSPDTVISAGSHTRRCVHCNSDRPPGIQYKCKNCGKSIISSPFVSVDGSELVYSTAPTGVSFNISKIGLVPEALVELINERNKVKKQMKDVAKGTQEYLDLFNKSTALKVLANSFYGQLGAPFTRYYVREVAESVTLTAQYFIKLAIESLKKRGMNVIYGDTDSCFVQGEQSVLQSIVDNLNAEVFVEEMKRMRCREFRLNFSYEKRYARYLIVGKKNYAGWIIDMEGEVPRPHRKLQDVIDRFVDSGVLMKDVIGTLDVKGLEMMRGDRVRIARELQQQIILMVVRDGINDIDVIRNQCKKYRDRFENDTDISVDDIVISKSISKDPFSYAGNITTHVVIARRMKKEGLEMFPGMKIRYIITDGFSSPVKAVRYEEFDGKYDRVCYWNKQVWPSTVRVLSIAIPTYPWHGFTLSGRGSSIQREFNFGGDIDTSIPMEIEHRKPGIPVSMKVRGGIKVAICKVYLYASGEYLSFINNLKESVTKCPGTTSVLIDVIIPLPDKTFNPIMIKGLLKSRIVDFNSVDGVDSIVCMNIPVKVDYQMFYSLLTSSYGDQELLLGIVPLRGNYDLKG